MGPRFAGAGWARTRSGFSASTASGSGVVVAAHARKILRAADRRRKARDAPPAARRHPARARAHSTTGASETTRWTCAGVGGPMWRRGTSTATAAACRKQDDPRAAHGVPLFRRYDEARGDHRVGAEVCSRPPGRRPAERCCTDSSLSPVAAVATTVGPAAAARSILVTDCVSRRDDVEEVPARPRTSCSAALLSNVSTSLFAR